MQREAQTQEGRHCQGCPFQRRQRSRPSRRDHRQEAQAAGRLVTASDTRLGAAPRYAPLVPTFSPYTAEAGAAVRLAWRLTVCAALLLVAIVVGVPLLRGWYVNSATEPRTAHLTTIDGVVFVRRDGARDWQPAAPDTRLEPGDSLRTAAN